MVITDTMEARTPLAAISPDPNHRWGGAWQKNEGDFFPQWLEQTAIELIRPITPVDEVLARTNEAEYRRVGPMTHLSWTTASGTAQVHNILRSSVAFQNTTGLLLYASGLGWGAEFKDYADFHGRMVAHTVKTLEAHR